ncbi:hypothetical protein C4D60_Mb06t27080 [Musa balbisiana]|uniref:Uncharacterized protein n=1 Tax=Musa balbisiana TaxID=52838 RepID=A0A4S8IR05_MUSBA|nr:hypothetical protein C4D60_Mb06t27080 [Musa balbisiana]
MVPQRRDFREVIDPLLSKGRERLVVKGVKVVENAEANSKYQNKAKGELRKTGVNELLIKMAESEGLRVDARVHDQGTKQAVHGVVPLLLSGVGN